MIEHLTIFAQETLAPKRVLTLPDQRERLTQIITKCHRIENNPIFHLTDSNTELEKRDIDRLPIAEIHNPEEVDVNILEFDSFIKEVAVRKNDLPSCCDQLLWTDNEVLCVELSSSQAKYVSKAGIDYAVIQATGQLAKEDKQIKRAKALLQLRNSVKQLSKSKFGVSLMSKEKKSAGFFFRLTDPQGPAGIMARAFSRAPIFQTRTSYPPSPDFPDWEFFSQPHHQPYQIQ
ncbi:MAG: hypothetical protein K2N88_08980 [Muribaculaceae bacterium]|nr:hypothetical protein [Muribaculaceae bacterium]